LSGPWVHDTCVVDTADALTTVLSRQVGLPLQAGERSPAAPAAPPGPPVPPAPPTARKRHRTLALVVALVLLSLAAGLTGWWFGAGRYVRVPGLVGLTPAAAERAATHDHLRWALAPTRIYSDTVAAGLVAGQLPGAGSHTPRGHTVLLQVSKGPQMDTVPSVVGSGLAAARAALLANHLAVGPVASAYSDTTPTGEILRTDPAPGQVVRHGTAVALTVSAGPVPVQLPSVLGEPLGAAETALRQLSLQVKVAHTFSSQVPAGDVVSTDPVAGTTLHHGDTVTVTVSQGPPYVLLPSLVGDSPAQAENTLATLGLVARVDQFPGTPGTTVVGQSPGPGRVRQGSTVTLYVF
ncbi:MAG: PASTA domain-containing protein, partial [Mycobacteriales bacterium]